jgi:hypothetical protein
MAPPPTASPGDVIGIASRGSKRGAALTRSFIIPGREYERGKHGFVIDPARHLPSD